MTIDYAKICLQLQIQRNQFADAHATAAARAETLAEELDKVKADVYELRAKIAELEKPKPEMPPVTLLTDEDEEALLGLNRHTLKDFV